MDNKLKKLDNIIEEEWRYVYNSLISKSKEFSGIGEEHINVENDAECKGAIKAMDYIRKKLGELNG